MAKKSARKKSAAKAKRAARKPAKKAARRKLAAKASRKKLAAKAPRKKLAAKAPRKAAKKPARKPAKIVAISATTAVLATEYLPPDPTEVSADVQTAEITEEATPIDPEPPAETIP